MRASSRSNSGATLGGSLRFRRRRPSRLERISSESVTPLFSAIPCHLPRSSSVARSLSQMDFFFASGVKGGVPPAGLGAGPYRRSRLGGLKGGAAPLTSARGYNAVVATRVCSRMNHYKIVFRYPHVSLQDRFSLSALDSSSLEKGAVMKKIIILIALVLICLPQPAF